MGMVTFDRVGTIEIKTTMIFIVGYGVDDLCTREWVITHATAHLAIVVPVDLYGKRIIIW
jgi:hypothetical protein